MTGVIMLYDIIFRNGTGTGGTQEDLEQKKSNEWETVFSAWRNVKATCYKS